MTKRNEIEISEKFQPLFELLHGKYPDVDTVIMTGGRYSLKSYTVSIFANTALRWFEWNILYTRYTNSTIIDSIKPEVSDKIEMLGLQNQLTDTKTHIEYKSNRIAFKGIKPGAKAQTANLKSLSGFNCFVNDEAEELPDLKTFKKIFYSIRDAEKRNLSILILNPTTKEHWIFQEFFEKKGLEGGENCIIDNVMYIHTSYLDATLSKMPPNILADYERMKIEEPEDYENIILGGWITEPDGVLLPKSQLKFQDLSNIPEENIIFRFAIGDPADTGGDKFSQPFIHVASLNDRIVCFVKDVIHSTYGIEANVERIPQKLIDNDIEALFLEDNGVGLAAVLLIKKKLPVNIKFVPFPSTIKKEVRILSHFEFVKRFFVFDINYKNNPEYRDFINDATGYMKDGDNKHRMDAIDILCSAANIVKLKYHKIIYGK
ncbi:phage terminase large subunit [Mariniphaga sediminis]|uniref:phage terminase large subunit n=1 Tax=Mariniphaga sediminis TaxID=1628158 RepID=UPI00356573DA